MHFAPGESRYLELTHAFAEVVANGRLKGEFQSHVLLAPAELVPVWREIAPAQPVEPLDCAATTPKCIVFDLGEAAGATLARLKRGRPSGAAISFFTEYYPSVCAATYAPGHVASSLGRGVVMLQTPRVGGRLMKDMIGELADFAAPEEWVRPPLMQAIRLGVVGLVDHLTRCALHQQAVHRYWAGCIVLPFLDELWHRMASDERQRLLDFLGSAHTFLLTRRDRVAHTWSQIKAEHDARYQSYSREERGGGTNQLQPVEKFWLWCMHNQEHLPRQERFAQLLLRQAGRTLPVVAHEELRQRPISEDVHRRILGPLYKRGTHKLNPDGSSCANSPDADDAPTIAGLTEVVKGLDLLDFAGWRGLERASVMISSDSVWIEGGRLEVRSGTILCAIPFTAGNAPSTVGLQLDVVGSDAFPVRLQVEVSETRRELYTAQIRRTSGYLLLGPGEVARRGIRYRINVGEKGDAEDKSARVRLRRLFSVPADFGTQPEFPWMALEQNGGEFMLYRFT